MTKGQIRALISIVQGIAGMIIWGGIIVSKIELPLWLTISMLALSFFVLAQTILEND